MDYKSAIRTIPDYPKPGIVFKDITPLLADGPALQAVVRALASGHGPVDKVVGIEARGFILAASAACELGSGFVPVRKQGRLPGPTYEQSYELEYGTATVEVHQDAFRPGERVLIIDDVLATGGTAQATASLVRRACHVPACCGIRASRSAGPAMYGVMWDLASLVRQADHVRRSWKWDQG